MPRQRNEELLRALGARLQEIRQARGVTQEALAEALGIQPSTLSRLETGRRALSVSMLAEAAAFLDCSLRELVDVEAAAAPSSAPPAQLQLVALFSGLGERDRALLVALASEMARSR